MVLYDPKVLELTLHKLPMLDHRVAEDLAKRLGQADPSLKEVLQAYAEAGVQPLPYPFEAVADRIGEALGVPSLKARRTLNTIAVAASLHLLSYPLEPLLQALALQFRGRCWSSTARWPRPCTGRRRPGFPSASGPGPRARPDLPHRGPGRRFGQARRRPPLPDLLPHKPRHGRERLPRAHTHLPGADVAVVQTEDEIAAVNMAVGAALAGAKAATATSGPGFSLMAEGLGFAGMIEAPLVVTLYQRGGPSTGLPTRTEQGDLMFAIRGGHGEYPRLVLASGDILDAFLDAQKALAWAWRYQTVVVHLLDKFLASLAQSLPKEALKVLSLDGEKRLSPGRASGPTSGTPRERTAFPPSSPSAPLGASTG